MGVIIAGLICLAATLIRLFPGCGDLIPEEVQEVLELLTPVLVLYLVYAAWPRKNSAASAALQKQSASPQDLYTADRIAELERENQARANKQRQLERALTEARARIENSKEVLNGSTRDALVDAELLNLLSLFQDKGRLLDFLMDDITTYGDAQIGAAARVVHQGCSAVLREYFDLSPVHDGKEGEKVHLPSDFKSDHYRLMGRVKDTPPYEGVLLHRGWRANKVKLPRVMKSGSSPQAQGVITPAEVEVS